MTEYVAMEPRVCVCVCVCMCVCVYVCVCVCVLCACVPESVYIPILFMISNPLFFTRKEYNW